MTNGLAWESFDYWFDKNGHWMFGVRAEDKKAAEKAWAERGIIGLPAYLGARPK